MKARYDVLKALYGEFSAVDTWLNAIDKRHSAVLLAFKRKLTYGPRNAEDLSGPPGVRERLGDLIGRMSGNYGPPTQPQLDEAAALHQLFDTLSSEYRSLH
jgi:hypothetical protein